MLLSSVARLNMGQSPESSTYNETGEGLPFFQGKTDFGLRHPQARQYCVAPKKIAEKGDILISVRAPVGPVNIASETCCIGRGLGAIRAYGVDQFFLYFELQYLQPTIEALGSGAIFKAINKNQLADVLVNRGGFDLEEQRQIARVLATVQRAIEQQQAIITTTCELKRSLMHKLFTEGLRGEAQKPTEIGLVPESWDVVVLGRVARIGNGSTPKRTTREYWEGGHLPWLTSGKIHEGNIDSADEFVTELAAKECHLPMVPTGSVLVAITGQGKTLGNAALVSFDTHISQHLAYISIAGNALYSPFVFRYLQSRYEYLRSVGRAGGSTKAALTCGFLKSVVIPKPDWDEQKEIADAFDILDDKLSLAERKRSHCADLFKTLLHQLMTAQVRVHNLDLDALGVPALD
ncbi:restriction endonuclease subunit S [Propionivibrio sp.]|uniref:restriction endonuclease subunit S n=1 Tax=Propionivibrio sp. TaxID=2212460 RepID=UPI00272E7C98|nr:restriction endonuclease subunit S [Propionivibrio sp.]